MEMDALVLLVVGARWLGGGVKCLWLCVSSLEFDYLFVFGDCDVQFIFAGAER